MAHDDDYDANDNDVDCDGAAYTERVKWRVNKKKRTKRSKESPGSNFRYRLSGVLLKLQSRQR